MPKPHQKLAKMLLSFTNFVILTKKEKSYKISIQQNINTIKLHKNKKERKEYESKI